jgi:hypothetical protein
VAAACGNEFRHAPQWRRHAALYVYLAQWLAGQARQPAFIAACRLLSCASLRLLDIVGPLGRRVDRALDRML